MIEMQDTPEGRREITALFANKAAQFVMWALMEGSWQGCDIDGGAAQDKAQQLGLITVTAYDPEKHRESDSAEPGDVWYMPSEELLAALANVSENKGGSQ